MIRTALLPLLLATPAAADLTVVTDIAPVQALVAEVMEGAGTPALLVPPGASPHDFSLRPSDAAALAEAGHIVWVGEGLTPWLTRLLETLPGEGAGVTELMEVPGWTALPTRSGLQEGGAPEDTEEDHDHDASAGDDQDDHADHDHEDHSDHEGHEDHEDGAEHAHDHGATDPHAWLDPAVAAVWVVAIGEEFAAADPDNAELYRSNAALSASQLDLLATELRDGADPLPGVLLPHDAFQYLEAALDWSPAGYVTAHDDADPGPAHLADLRDRIDAGEVSCLMIPPGPQPGWVAALADGTDLRIGRIDPLGAEGQSYADTIRTAVAALEICGDGEGL